MKLQIDPQIDGGFDTFHLVSAATTNATSIKSKPGQIFGWFIYNSNAAVRKVNFYDTNKIPIVGTSIVKFSLPIPPLSGANILDGVGIEFVSGIAISTVTGLPDSDSAAVALNDLVINIWFK